MKHADVLFVLDWFVDVPLWRAHRKYCEATGVELPLGLKDHRAMLLNPNGHKYNRYGRRVCVCVCVCVCLCVCVCACRMQG